MNIRITEPKLEVTLGRLDYSELTYPHDTFGTPQLTLSMRQAIRLRDALDDAITQHNIKQVFSNQFHNTADKEMP